MQEITDSVCKDRGLHDYSITKWDDDKILVEICTECGREIRFHKDEVGRIDNKRYGETHLRWFLQPSNPLYLRYYAKPPPPLPTKAEARKRAIEIAQEEFERAGYKS